MRIFLSVLILIFSLQSWTKADDIKDFQIEGMSLYDSALDYYTEKQIKKYTANYKYNNNDYIPVATSKNIKVYDSIQFYHKSDDKKTIGVITGTLWFENDIEGCLDKKKTIKKEIENLFINAKKVDLGTIKIDYDKSGKSTKTNYRFVFENGDYVLLACYDWSKKFKYKDHLRVGVVSKDFDYWIYNVASK